MRNYFVPVSLVFLATVFLGSSESIGLPDCSADMKPTDKKYDCHISLKDLLPTQFNVGLAEVAKKQKVISDLNEGDRKDYLRDHPIPIVIGPHGKFYATDHHHLAVALFFLHIKQAYGKIIKNWSDETEDNFWKKMVDAKEPNDAHYVWLFDLGEGPKKPKDLPQSISELSKKDDPYRSFAEEVRDAGGYSKKDLESVFFVEFKWADFFRTRVEIGPKALAKALELAHSDAASKLPGFIRTKR